MKKTCFVPCCMNSSTSTPNKIFIRVPRESKSNTRMSWFQAVGLPAVKTCGKFCCEDHFNLKEDSVDFSHYKRTGNTPRIKTGILPHLFLKVPNPNTFFSQFEESQKSSESESENEGDIYIPELMEASSESGSEEAGPSCRQKQSEVTEEEYIMDTSISADTSASSRILNTSTEGSQIIISDENEKKGKDFRNLSMKREILDIDMHPRFYLGLTNDVYHLIKIIYNHQHILERDVLIVLKKIRLGDSFFRLGLDFGLSCSYVSKLFSDNVLKMEDVMKHFIFWPDVTKVLQFLPIPCRYRYDKVVSIIDCFEISIEKPSNPVHQAMTWSQYNNCNTMKYLISSTPYGFINFISDGYGGRASDLAIVVNCGYLDKLPPSSVVLADRGFKHLASVLSVLSVKLIRPVSVSAEEQLSEKDVRESRNISALRIHKERVIIRIREFVLLSPHADIDVNFIGHLNACVTIACGIINLQPKLIKMTY